MNCLVYMMHDTAHVQQLRSLTLSLPQIVPYVETAPASETVPVHLAAQHLQQLTISGDPSLDTLHIACPQLTQLHASSNVALKTLEVAPGSALQELSVAGSTLQTGCLEAVARCAQQLTKLDVSYNALVSDGTLRAVAMCCAKLKMLKASGCRGIGGDSLARSLSAPGFTGLHQITISHAKLLGAHLVALLAGAS
jgi:hypothetical protein